MPTSFTIIPPDQLAYATPAERRAYELALRRHVALMSPLDYALATRKGAQDFPHSRYVSDKIANLPPGGKVIIMMPPRHGKSYILSETVPAWVLANDPNAHIIHASYAYDFTKTFGRKIRNLLQYAHGRSLAPAIDPHAKAVDKFLIEESYGEGDYTATGVGGQITGLPANWLLFDDLVKNYEEAHSKTIRESIWNWFIDDGLSRLEPGARAVLLGTPRHEDDVIGRAAETGEWEVIRLPALAEDGDVLGRELGEALCPQRYTVPDLEKIRKRNASTFTALYQCRPRPEDGDIFKRQNFRYYTKLPDKGFRFATVDLAHSTKTRADYSVLMCFFASAPPNPRLYVTHVFRAKIESGAHMAWLDDSIDTIERKEWPSYIGIEDKTFGSTLLSTARVHGRFGKPQFRPLSADTDKITRSSTAVTLSTQGQLVLLEGAPWLTDLEYELLAFDNGKHDDQVDTLSYGALEFVKGRQKAPAPAPKPPKTDQERAAAQILRRKKAGKPSKKALMR